MPERKAARRGAEEKHSWVRGPTGRLAVPRRLMGISLAHAPFEQGIERKLSRSEDQHEQSGEEKGVRIGVIELSWVADYGGQGGAVRDNVGRHHIDGEGQASEPRQQADR